MQTIEQAWQVFLKDVIQEQLRPMAEERLRLVFYAGARSAMMGALASGNMDQEKGAQQLAEMALELDTFFQGQVGAEGVVDVDA